MSQIPASRRVLVLGAAAEAQTAVEALLANGYPVDWSTPGACPSPSTQATQHPFSQLLALHGQAGAFSADLQGAAAAEPRYVGAVIVATGNQRTPPALCQQPGAALRLLVVPQMRKRLQESAAERNPMAHVHQRLLFLLDWGGESSREAAVELLECALWARRAWRAEVFLAYRDLKVDTRDLDYLTRTMRELGIVFCRYGQDARPPTAAISWDDQSVSFTYVEGTLHADLAILPEDVAPASDTASLAAALQIRLGEDGYFQDINVRHLRSGLGSRRGVFLAGRCHADLDEPSAREDALLAASNVAALLAPTGVQRNDVVARVDTTKCIRCLTCLRSCPHSAIEVVAYPGEQVVAAHVLDLACEGCGTCISNCPVRAIAFVGQLLPAWMA